MSRKPNASTLTDDNATNSAEAARRPWWQWILVHPQVPLALISAISGAVLAAAPQLVRAVEAFRLDVRPADVPRAHELLRTWEANRGCIGKVENITLRTETKYNIDLLPCPSGDILVTLTPLHNPDNPVTDWIITRNLFKKQARFSFTTAAVAQERPRQMPIAQATRVIDIKTQGRTVQRRVQLSDNTCIDETIDAITGRRLHVQNAPCARY